MAKPDTRRYKVIDPNRTYNNWDVLEQQEHSGGGVTPTDVYTKDQVDDLLSYKQDTMTAGNNIIINGTTINANVVNDGVKSTTQTYSSAKIESLIPDHTKYATVEYVDAQDTKVKQLVTDEALARTKADTELQNEININKANITLNSNNLTVLTNNFNDHKTEADENIRKLQTQITNEATTRGTKDSELEAKIASLEADIKVEVVDTVPTTPVNNTMYFIKQPDGTYIRKLYNNNNWYDMGNTEVDLSNYYTKTETYSQEQIDTKYNTLNAAITAETTNRTNADTTLQTLINAEVTARTDADSNLQDQINTNKTDIATNKTNIATNTADITDLKNDKQDKTDDDLQTDDKTIVGAINEVYKRTTDDIIDMVYPIGSIYISISGQTPTKGTWAKLASGISLWNTDLGGGATLDGQLPDPDITLEETGNHSHTRGTMDITGSLGALVCDASSYISGSGAFYVASTPRTRSWSGASGNEIRSFGFQASKNWTGNTSEDGKHVHAVTINNTQYVSGDTTVRPTSIAVTMYQRIG